MKVFTVVGSGGMLLTVALSVEAAIVECLVELNDCFLKKQTNFLKQALHRLVGNLITNFDQL